MGLPYALSSDLVSAYPAKSLAIADYVDGLIPLLAMTQNAQTGTTYSFVLTDFTKLVTLSNAAAVAVTLPLEATVAWPTGTQLRLLNQGAGTVTVAGAVGVTINGTPLTLAQYKGANLIKTGTNTWTFIPFASGGAAAVISSTTGSPTVTTDGTATIYKYTGDGTLVVGTAGIATVLTVGSGGGGGRGGGGGGGGSVLKNIVNLTAQTYTIKVAAGGAGATVQYEEGRQALPSYITGTDTLCASSSGGGGGGASANTRATLGGSSGGGGQAVAAAPTASGTAIGFTGGLGIAGAGTACGGGGGAGAVGGAAVSGTGGAGGAGASDSITGTAVLYGMGGGGGVASGTAGTAPTNGGAGATSTANGGAGAANFGGGGGGSGGNTTGNGGNGGSGVVIVRVG